MVHPTIRDNSEIIVWICSERMVSFWTPNEWKWLIQFSLLLFLYSQLKCYYSKFIHVEVAEFLGNVQIRKKSKYLRNETFWGQINLVSFFMFSEVLAKYRIFHENKEMFDAYYYSESPLQISEQFQNVSLIRTFFHSSVKITS